MAHWYNVYHNEDYEAEIQVGLYEQWVRQLDCGTSQAERALFHTQMMDLADERRFAVCQAGFDMSFFEVDHSRRIKQALFDIQLRLSTCVSREVCEAAADANDEDLIGLTQSSTHNGFVDCSQFSLRPVVPHAPSVQNNLDSMLREARQITRKKGLPSPAVLSSADNPDNSDDEDYMAFQAQLYEKLVTTRKKARTAPSGGALQCKPVRYRRDQGLLTKDTGKRRPRTGPHVSNLA